MIGITQNKKKAMHRITDRHIAIEVPKDATDVTVLFWRINYKLPFRGSKEFTYLVGSPIPYNRFGGKKKYPKSMDIIGVILNEKGLFDQKVVIIEVER